LAPLKRILGTKKIGHTGTLDQFAQGLILCLVGPFTKLNPYLMDWSKTYEAEICFGQGTDTLDPTGLLIDQGPIPTMDSIREALPRFQGMIEQIPPKFSALKVQGKRASDRVRAGEEVQLEPRKVFIHSLDFLSYETPYLKLRIVCSKGTYIRSIARDLSGALGTCAHLRSLVRTAQGPLDLSQAKYPEEIGPQDLIRPQEFSRFWSDMAYQTIDLRGQERLRNGHYPSLPGADKPLLGLFDSQGSLLAMAKNEGGQWKNLFVVPQIG
jgi:tRNA pseudouridine55 synthase